MKKFVQFFLKVFICGFLLWLFGYVLGIVFFFFLPPSVLGWAIMPIGIVVTWLALKKFFHQKSTREYFLIAVVWTLLAIVCDYFFLVKIFKPADGYYKLDVYLYYVITFLLPITFWAQSKVLTLETF